MGSKFSSNNVRRWMFLGIRTSLPTCCRRCLYRSRLCPRPRNGTNVFSCMRGRNRTYRSCNCIYDPAECSYEDLLDTFFARVDPTTVNGQGNDRGKQYRTGVYFHTKEQEEIARARFTEEQKNYQRPIASECMPAMPFWPAEKYHQQYLEKGGRFNQPQDASKGATATIRCYG